jgi:ABC-type phosphate transport system substrate-binding protein
LIFFSLLATVERVGAVTSDVAMVANPVTPVDSLTLGEARRIFLGEQTTWSPALPVILLLGEPRTHARSVALRTVYRMSEPEFNQYWIVRMFRGETNGGPKTVSSNVVAQLVRQLPGCVTFVDAAEITTGMKVIRIDGKLPGDPGYPLK